MAHRARKRFSQNFLVDQLVIDRIIETIAPKPGEHMVEIGPGLGAITRPLSRIVRPLRAVEVDRDIVRTLRAEFPPSELIVYEGDALQFDFRALGPQLRIVGNLPYHISTPILFHLSESVESLRDIHVMLQAEVVDRMLAEPGSADYGRLSVMLQYRFGMEKLLDVPSTAFRPQPKVESAVVRMLPRTDMKRARNEPLLSATVALAFSQRRKTLRNTLGGVLSSQDFEALHIDAQARAQTLTVEQFVAVADYREARAHGETSGSEVRS